MCGSGFQSIVNGVQVSMLKISDFIMISIDYLNSVQVKGIIISISLVIYIFKINIIAISINKIFNINCNVNDLKIAGT